MTHKNYTKTPTSRRIFFWTLTLSFFVITTTIIFFSLGYRFNFVDDIFIQAGSINVKSIPRAVTVYIDGKKPSGRHLNFINDSYHITGIHYGNHDVRFSADGYKDWEKNVRIHSGIATEFWNIILVKNTYTRTPYILLNPAELFFAPGHHLVASTKDDTPHLFLTITDLEKNTTIATLINRRAKRNPTTKENIEWSPSTRYLSIPVIITQDETTDATKKSPKKDTTQKTSKPNPTTPRTDDTSPEGSSPTAIPRKDYLIVQRTEDNLLPFLSLRSLLPKRFFTLPASTAQPTDTPSTDVQAPAKNQPAQKPQPTKQQKEQTPPQATTPTIRAVRFAPKNQQQLYAIINDDLYSITIPKDITQQSVPTTPQQEPTLLMSDVIAYDFADDGIFVLTKNGVLFYDRDYALTTPHAITGFDTVTADTDNRIIAYDKNRILLINDTTGALTIYNKKDDNIFTKTLGTNIVYARFSDDGKKIIFHDGHTVYLFMTRDWDTQPTRTKNTLYTIATVPQEITATDWTGDYEHILITTDKTLSLLSIDTRFQGDLEPVPVLTRAVPSHLLGVAHGQKKIFFTDQAIEKTNDTQLFSIDFPQKQKGFFQ